MYWGTVLSHAGDTVLIGWDDDEEFYEVWEGKECKYRVDRGQMRFIAPPRERRVRLPDDQVFCKSCGKPRSMKCGCPRPGAVKPEEWGQVEVHQRLTGINPHDKMVISIEGNAPDDEERKGAMMAKRKVVEVVEDELDDVVEVDDTVELEELDDATESDAVATSDNKLTAKAAASLLGTDGRTLRKFLRKKFGLVGQGQRWGVDPEDMEALKAEFTAWHKGGTKAEPKKKPKADAEPAEPLADAELDELEEIEEIEDLDFSDEDD